MFVQNENSIYGHKMEKSIVLCVWDRSVSVTFCCERWHSQISAEAWCRLWAVVRGRRSGDFLSSFYILEKVKIQQNQEVIGRNDEVLRLFNIGQQLEEDDFVMDVS